jgi:hypothetical protein
MHWKNNEQGKISFRKFSIFQLAKQRQYRNLGFEDHCSVKKRRNEIRG